MRKFTKTIATMSLAFALVATLIVPTASAATNVQKSVDPVNKGSITSTYSVTTLATKKDEITIGKGGIYDLKLNISKSATLDGFVKISNNEITLSVGKDKAGNDIYVSVPVKWTSNLPQYASVNANGRIAANKVAKLNADGSYKKVVVSASIPDVVYTNKDGKNVKFVGGVIYNNYVTVVPETDLSNYFLGVWKEDLTDLDAQHNTDFAVNSANVDVKLKDMAELATGHCLGTTFDVRAYTKTNDATVRAYITTHSKVAGNHYYVMAFNNNNNANTITVTARDYCETSYNQTGTFVR